MNTNYPLSYQWNEEQALAFGRQSALPPPVLRRVTCSACSGIDASLRDRLLLLQHVLGRIFPDFPSLDVMVSDQRVLVPPPKLDPAARYRCVSHLRRRDLLVLPFKGELVHSDGSVREFNLELGITTALLHDWGLEPDVVKAECQRQRPLRVSVQALDQTWFRYDLDVDDPPPPVPLEVSSQEEDTEDALDEVEVAPPPPEPRAFRLWVRNAYLSEDCLLGHGRLEPSARVLFEAISSEQLLDGTYQGILLRQLLSTGVFLQEEEPALLHLKLLNISI